MFAPLKRIAILAVALLFPGVAFSYVSIENFEIDNLVPSGSEGFVVAVHAIVDPGDTWESSWFNLDNYTDICLNHEDFGPGEHFQVFYVPFNSETANSSDEVDLYTYRDDGCGDDNQWSVWYDRDLVLGQGSDWPEVIQFGVNKVFRPVSDQEVLVNINCTAGSPGDDSAMMGDNGVQIFPQEFLNPSNPNHNCVITEADVPAGYEAMYITNPQGIGTLHPGLASTEGCFFYGSGNMRADNQCRIVNAGLPATFTVTKDWYVFQDDDANFVELDELRVQILASCTRQFLSMHVADEGECMDDDADSSYNGCFFDKGQVPIGSGFAGWTVTGDATITYTVDNDGYDPVVCIADERAFYSNIERVSSTCREGFLDYVDFEIGPGGSASCGFVNTVFFEGIPTLSQYGMAIMALLMLGVGFVGFRRFV